MRPRHPERLKYTENRDVIDEQTRLDPRDWALLALALALLNAALTLGNIWPTPFIRITGDLSLELAVGVLGLVVLRRLVTAHRRGVLRVLSSVWVLLTLGRYAAVTTQSLWGRDINLYWDMPHVPAVGAMLAFVASPWVIGAVIGALVLVPLAVYAPIRWSLGRVVDATGDARGRRVLVVMALAIATLGGIQRLIEDVPQWPGIATPVTLVWARQARQFAHEMSGAGMRELGPAPVLASNLAHLRGADVFLVFVESYGAISWDRPAFATELAGAPLRRHQRQRPRGGVGLRRVPHVRRRVVARPHQHVVGHRGPRRGHEHAAHGPVARDDGRAVCPAGLSQHRHHAGIQSAWPEGKFYGFDTIYGAPDLAYEGPSFGWWDITYQFCLAKMDALEVAPSGRAPLFAVFPTISTHTPFTPVPPYQPDWARALTSAPYDAQALQQAYSVPPDWLDLGPGYVAALQYAYATFGGYLRFRADRDLVLILIGDHQPPALVSGEGASWEVPIHVITNRRAVLDRLLQRGFTRGLAPRHPAIAKMHAVTPVLLDAFGDGQ